MPSPTLVTAKPIASPLGQVFLHVTAVVHSPETDLFLPPHRATSDPTNPEGSQGEGKDVSTDRRGLGWSCVVTCPRRVTTSGKPDLHLIALQIVHNCLHRSTCVHCGAAYALPRIARGKHQGVNAFLSLAGFCGLVAGVWLNWGLGYALLLRGLLLFLAGGLGSARDRRGS